MASTRTRVLGTTRIVDTLATGGMAEVFRGEQKALGRSVAVKVMLPEFAKKRDMVTRFRREARALAMLSHQNIVAVHDLIEKNGQLFIVMEYVHGVDVQRLLEHGRLPLDIALIVVTSVARALEHAHFHKIIHRDIKPANVLVSRAGTTKLTDFGVAKEMGPSDLTKTGFVVGTPSYLAPELFRGKTADGRSDFYALGILLYQCVSGEKPFRGKTPAELVKLIVGGERKRLRDVEGSCPRSVEKIVDRCLELDPDRRFQRASEVRKQLESELNRVLDGSPEARMASYLYERGEAEAEDLRTVDLVELAQFDASLPASIAAVLDELEAEMVEESEEVAESPRRRWRIGWVFVALLLLLLGAAGTAYVAAPDAVAELFGSVGWP